MKPILKDITYPKNFIFTIEKYDIVKGKTFANTYGTKPVKIVNYETLKHAISKLAKQFNVHPSEIDHKIVD